MGAFLPIADPVGAFALVALVAFLAALAADKARLPAPIIVLALGALLGAVGIVDAEGGLAPLAELGMIAAFFLAGLETDPARGFRKSAPAFLIGTCCFLLPMAAATALGPGLLGLGTAAALFLGLVLAPASSAGPRDNRAGTALAASGLAGALLRALALAFLAFRFRREGWPGILELGIMAFPVILMIAIIPFLAAHFFKKAKLDGTIEFLFLLPLAFLGAAGGGLAGLEPAVGAYFAGFLLRRYDQEGSLLRKRLRFAAESFFLPCLFFALGARLGAELAGAASSGRLAAGAFPAGAFPAELLLETGGLALVALVLMGALAAIATMTLVPRGAGGSDERSLAFGLALNRPAAAFALLALGRELGAIRGPLFAALLLALGAATAIGERLIRRGAPGAAAEQAASERDAGPARSDRVMVTVSNPANLKQLVELGLLLRPRGSSEPVYPVAVAAQCDEPEAELSRAEGILAQAMVLGADAGVPLKPAARLSVSVHEGILEAGREIGAGTVVLGWNKTPRLSRSFFGSVIDQVVRHEPELVVVARLSHPLASVSRLALVLPPAAEEHPGLERGLEALGSLVAALGLHLTIYLQRLRSSELRRRLSRIRGRGAVQLVELDSWKQADEAVRRQQSISQSAFGLLCTRPGGPGWHPAMEKLTQSLASAYPEAPLLLFYLPEAGGAASAPQPAADSFRVALVAGRVLTGMRETAIADGVRALLGTAFGGERKLLGRLAARFTEIAQKEPIELDPGVLLLHARIPEAEETLVFFGAKPDGFRLIALEEPVRVLVLICVPEEQSPEAHLAILGELARLFKDERLATRLLEAQRPADLEEAAPRQ